MPPMALHQACRQHLFAPRHEGRISAATIYQVPASPPAKSNHRYFLRARWSLYADGFEKLESEQGLVRCKRQGETPFQIFVALSTLQIRNLPGLVARLDHPAGVQSRTELPLRGVSPAKPLEQSEGLAPPTGPVLLRARKRVEGCLRL